MPFSFIAPRMPGDPFFINLESSTASATVAVLSLCGAGIGKRIVDAAENPHPLRRRPPTALHKLVGREEPNQIESLAVLGSVRWRVCFAPPMIVRR
jgi:hypothetical protein